MTGFSCNDRYLRAPLSRSHNHKPKILNSFQKSILKPVLNLRTQEELIDTKKEKKLVEKKTAQYLQHTFPLFDIPNHHRPGG